MSREILTLFFLMATALADTANDSDGGRFLALIEDKLELRFEEYTGYFTRWLEDFNDKHLGETELGRLLHYKDIKPKLDSDSNSTARRSSGRMKKMAMAMMPLVFHVGATSTWMILTSVMAAKSVAIGLALLVFKIAVSSAKLASFFTQLKSKHSDHHGWSWSPPHHEHHGHDRSFTDIEHHDDHSPPTDWHSYSPEWTPNEIGPPSHSHEYHGPPSHSHEYHTIPTSYKSDHDVEPYKDYHLEGKSDKKKFS